jgi:hypothetical protein
MFPFEIAPGTTIEQLLHSVLPKTHAKLVKPDEAGSFEVGVKVAPGKTWVLSIASNVLTTRESSATTPVWVHLEEKAAVFFLDDMAAAKRFVPKFVPEGGFTMLTDPRVLRRVSMVSGKIEIKLVDSPIGTISLFVAAGAKAKEGLHADDPDAVLELHMPTVEKILAGSLGPEAALSDGSVAIKGKRLVAMQFALAIAPYFKPPPVGR